MAEKQESPLHKANTMVIAGLTLWKDGKRDKALSCFDEALGYTADIWDMKARLLHDMKKFDKALSCHEMAAKLDPKNVDVLMGKGVALHHTKKYVQALEVYEQIIKIEPDCAQAWFNKACAFSMLEYDDEAIDCLRKAHEMDAKNTSIHLSTEEAFERLRKTPKFEKFVGKLRQREAKAAPASPDTSYIR